SRPSIDVLFRSAARFYRDAVIGVLLSGLLHDGVAGLAEIRSAGGRLMVQDPQGAAHADIPRSALQGRPVDAILRSEQMGRTLGYWAEELVGLVSLSALKEPEIFLDMPHGPHTGFVCPDCGGVLNEVLTGDVHSYRCRTGHSYSESGLFIRQ